MKATKTFKIELTDRQSIEIEMAIVNLLAEARHTLSMAMENGDDLWVEDSKSELDFYEGLSRAFSGKERVNE